MEKIVQISGKGMDFEEAYDFVKGKRPQATDSEIRRIGTSASNLLKIS